VIMEAYSVEDNGFGVCFCVYVYNVQPGVTINYFNGRNAEDGEASPEEDAEDAKDVEDSGDELPEDTSDPSTDGEISDYILNVNSKKFHLPGKTCSDSIKEENKESYTGTRSALIDDGYSPCGICKP